MIESLLCVSVCMHVCVYGIDVVLKGQSQAACPLGV